MNERGQYGRRQFSPVTRVGDSPVRTFATGALAGGILVAVGALWLRHAVIRQQEFVADVNRPRARLAT